jgi:hypothetical protein
LDTKRHDKNRSATQHIIVKTLRTEENARILKTASKKYQYTCNAKHIRIMADFKTNILKRKKGME